MSADMKKRGRGRPRPQAVIDRDKRLVELVNERPHSRAELATILGITESQVYLALSRLRGDGLVRRCVQEDGTNVWAPGGQPCR